jgi:hypothetical protein
LGPKLGAIVVKRRRDVKKLFAVNKYLPVVLALGALAAVGPAPAFAHKTFAHKNSGLTAYARAPATDYYNTVPSSLGPADRFSEASQR